MGMSASVVLLGLGRTYDQAAHFTIDLVQYQYSCLRAEGTLLSRFVGRSPYNLLCPVAGYLAQFSCLCLLASVLELRVGIRQVQEGGGGYE